MDVVRAPGHLSAVRSILVARQLCDYVTCALEAPVEALAQPDLLFERLIAGEAKVDESAAGTVLEQGVLRVASIFDSQSENCRTQLLALITFDSVIIIAEIHFDQVVTLCEIGSEARVERNCPGAVNSREEEPTAVEGRDLTASLYQRL